MTYTREQIEDHIEVLDEYTEDGCSVHESRAILRQLLAENDALKEIDSMYEQVCDQMEALANDYSRIKKENDSLREDAERLDWMGSVDGGFYNIDRISADCSIGFWSGLNAKPKHANLREAIDAARKN